VNYQERLPTVIESCTIYNIIFLFDEIYNLGLFIFVFNDCDPAYCFNVFD